MEVAQNFIFEAGWIFFAGWATVLAAVGAIAFGRDIRLMIGGSSRQRN
ncbi:MAG: hypothetical protein ABSF97_16605 [Candidatus Sulfotelmatobacter sp.]|jgi:hypothetical protein